MDTSAQALPAVNVTLLEARDSVFVVFGLTDANGYFQLKRIEGGEYLLQVSYLGHESHWQRVQVTSGQGRLDLGKIILRPSSVVLSGVDIVAERVPLAMRNDTLEYNAAAFKTQPGSVVEDLLKKLPGVQVLPDGTIKAQGKTVQNVMVEGKDFFGQDPKIATKNLPADAVKKVQVFDKKSENAEFTGIDDGQEERTINLQLKDGKKQGYFGKAGLGVGTEGRYEGNFNINSFGRRVQVSALGMANNTNEQNFSFQDYLNFMGGLGNFISGGSGGRTRLSFNLEEGGVPLGPGLDRGFTDTRSGGANLNLSLSKRTSLSANYFYNRIENELERSIFRVNTLGESSFNAETFENRLTRNAGHRLNLNVKHKIDSFQQISFRSRFNYNDGHFESAADALTYGISGAAENSSQRTYANDNQRLNADGRLTYRRRLGRKGRAMMASASASTGTDERNGMLSSTNRFLTQMPPDTLLLRQRQAYTDDIANYSGSLSYTEPLGRGRYAELRVEHQQFDNNTDKKFYDRPDSTSLTEIFNPLLSNAFRRGYRYERAGFSLMKTTKKSQLTLTTALQQSQLDGVVANLETPISRRFTRVLPSAFFEYDLKNTRHLKFEYVTELREPSLEELQPAPDNSDPLDVYVGNPALRPEYAHHAELNFMNFDQFVMSSYFGSLSATYVNDRITNTASVDSLFRRLTRPVNVNYDYTLRLYNSYSTPIRPFKINLSANVNNTWNRGILYVNQIENRTDRWQHAVEMSIDNRKKDWMDWTLGLELAHNSTRFSASTQLNQAYVNQRYFGEFTVFPTKKWAIGTGLDYAIYSPENFGEKRSIPLWRASIKRYVLKNNKGQIKLAVADILKQNLGINRSSQFNFIEEERTVNLTRYFMLGFSWSLNGFNEDKNVIEIKH